MLVCWCASINSTGLNLKFPILPPFLSSELNPMAARDQPRGIEPAVGLAVIG